MFCVFTVRNHLRCYVWYHGLIRIGQKKRWGYLTLMLMNASVASSVLPSSFTPIDIFWLEVTKPLEKYKKWNQDEVLLRLSISLNRSDLKYSSLKTLTEKGGDFLADSCSMLFILIIFANTDFRWKQLFRVLYKLPSVKSLKLKSTPPLKYDDEIARLIFLSNLSNLFNRF